MRPDLTKFDSVQHALGDSGDTVGSTIIGTPDDLVKAIRAMQEVTGGFGTVVGFAHDWANPEATARSWDMVARYVIPEVNGMLDAYRDSNRHVIEHRDSFNRAGDAIMAKIAENENAVKAMEEGAAAPKTNERPAIAPHHAPDLKSAG